MDVGGDHRRERLKLGERQRIEPDAARFRVAHREGDRFVRIAEGHALANEVVREIGRRRMAFGRGLAHAIRVDGDASGDEVGQDRQRVGERIDRVEQRLLVFLVVAVVRERLALHQGEERDQVTRDAPGLAARQFRHVRILLLRHDRRPGAEPVGKRDEGEARVRPPDELFREARDVRHRQRGGGQEFDREVAIRHGIERIRAQRFEPELVRDALAVDREARAGERRASQRKAIDPPAGIGQSLGVAREHRLISEQVVAERHGLCHLQVRVARHDRRGVRFGEIDERAPQGD
jgi:hypothetical protein